MSCWQGGTYLLPWASKDSTKVDKLYHYNPAGGSTTWSLTDAFAGQSSLQLFELTDTGRAKVADVPVVNGQVTIDADASQPYVLTAGSKSTKASALPKAAKFGDKGVLVDPGFNAGALDAWNPTGGATTLRDDLGRRFAQLGTDASSLTQRLGGLDEGTYSVSACGRRCSPASRGRPRCRSMFPAGHPNR